MSPTTALIYAYVNLQPSDIPSVAPEEDIFARALEYATMNGPRSKEKDMASVVIEGPLEDSPDEIVLDEFLCREAFEWEEISPSSSDISSADHFSNPSAAVLSSAKSLPSLHGIDNPGHYLRPGTCEELPKNPILGGLQFSIVLSRVEKPSFALDAAQTLYSPGGQTQASTTQQKIPQRRRRQRKIPTEDDEATKRKAFLERNRMAAQKCRSRKRERTSTLEENVAEQEEENLRLKEEIGELTVELGSLRDLYTQYEMECCHQVHQVHGEGQKEHTETG